jgi:hypothetical protein
MCATFSRRGWLTARMDLGKKLRFLEYFKVYVPVRSCEYFVKIFPAFFTEILFGTCVFVHDANAPAVLPDLANVALQKKSGQVFRHICDSDYGFFNSFPNAMFAVFVAELWWAWVFVESANAANGLIVLSNLFSAIRCFDLNCLDF